MAIVAYSSLAGALLLLPAAAYDLATRPPAGLSPAAWLAVLYLGLGCSVLAYLLWQSALRHLDASQAVSFLNLIPVVGVASAALALGETLLPGQLLGGALVLLGVWLVAR